MSTLPYVTMDEAARLLAVSRRTLTELIKRHPHYSWGGRKKAFYPKHVEALAAAIEEETREKCRSRSTDDQEAHIGTSASQFRGVVGFEQVLEHLTRGEQGPSPKRSKRKSGNVVPLATAKHLPSRRP